MPRLLRSAFTQTFARLRHLHASNRIMARSRCLRSAVIKGPRRPRGIYIALSKGCELVVARDDGWIRGVDGGEEMVCTAEASRATRAWHVCGMRAGVVRRFARWECHARAGVAYV